MKTLYALICLITIIIELFLVFKHTSGNLDSKKFSIISCVILLILVLGYFLMW